MGNLFHLDSLSGTPAAYFLALVRNSRPSYSLAFPKISFKNKNMMYQQKTSTHEQMYI
jgi:hypothetical protein